MGVTPIFGFPYPEDSTPNDLHQFFSDLAGAVETEMSRQGPLEQRPAAGKRGRLYFAITWVDPYASPTTNAPFNVLYRDTGTTWVQLTDSAVQLYRPVWNTRSGAPFTISLYGGSASFQEYQLKAGGMCWVNINQLLTLNGSAGTTGVIAGLPVNAISFTVASGSAQNRPCPAGVNNDDDVMEFYSGNFANGQNWDVNTSSPLWFRATTTYRIG